MKKLVLKLLVFGSLLFLIDKFFILLMNHLPELEADKRLELLVNGKMNKDLVIIGSSRGARNILAGKIESETGLKSYNLSYPGSDVTFHEFILRTLIKFNKTPKIVLLVVDDPKELLPEHTVNFRLERLYPLVKYDYILQELTNRGEKNEILAQIFVLHRFNISNFDLRHKKFTQLDSIEPCGSMPISVQRENVNWTYSKDVFEYPEELEETDKVNALKGIFYHCKSNKIDLVIVITPDYKSPSKSFSDRMKELAGSDFRIFHYDTLNHKYQNKEYFYDLYHLKTNGTEIFTQEIIHYLRNWNTSSGNTGDS